MHVHKAYIHTYIWIFGFLIICLIPEVFLQSSPSHRMCDRHCGGPLFFESFTPAKRFYGADR